MSDPHLQTLLFPFQDALALPTEAKVLCIGVGEFSPQLGVLAQQLTFVQGFRPYYQGLAAAGCRVFPVMPEGQFDAVLIRLGRHRGRNEQWFADALRQLRTGGILAVAGARTDGAASMRKRLERLIPGLSHQAMNHGEVFWFEVNEEIVRLADQIEPDAYSPVEGRFRTAPGMFSFNRVDAGSRLLASHLPADLSGRVADFGAGWGFLSVELTERCLGISHIDLYEADYASLQAAKLNLGEREGLEIGFFWHDLVHEPVTTNYDTIVTNPPFHAGRESEPDLGRAIIVRAAGALKPRGRLFLVANRALPYEQALSQHFTHWQLIVKAEGYKVLEARK